ncbi:cytochrome P450 [Seiridium cupressi]
MKEPGDDLRLITRLMAEFLVLMHPICLLALRGLLGFLPLPIPCREPENGKARPDELYGEAESLIIAGSDTTAIIMSAMFFYLARNPAIREKLVRKSCPHSPVQMKSRVVPSLARVSTFALSFRMLLRMTPLVSAEPSHTVMKGGTMADQ